MNVCPHCHERGWDHEKVKAKCEDSLYYFVKLIVSDWVSIDLHEPICRWYQQLADEGSHYYLIMIPRGHLKTTVFSVGLPLWRLINDPNLRILLVMSSSDLAQEKLSKIKDVCQSESFQHFWGHLVPGPGQKSRWSAAQMQIVRSANLEEPSVTALGAGTKLTGRHYDIQILDDLVDGMAVNSEVQMANAIDFLERSDGLWVRRKEAHQIVVGTLWPGGFYEDIIKDPDYENVILGCYVDDRYRKFLAKMGLKCTDEDGDPIFPEHETIETLERSARRFKSKFDHQMLNLLVADELRRFKRDDFQYYRWGDEQKSVVIDEVYYPLRSLFTQLCIDPGSGLDGSDETAITVTGWARGAAAGFVLDSHEARMTPITTIRMILDMADKWQPDVIRPEHVAMQVIYKDFLQDAMTKAGVYWPISPYKPYGGSKTQRIVEGLQPFVANHQLYFRHDQQDIIAAMCNMVIVKNRIKGRSPNLIDSLAFHVEYWNRTPQRVDSDEIQFIDPYHDSIEETRRQVRYGLRCTTRARMRRMARI